ncbi:hypothetical protein OG245_00175 [Streptomyces sp. NBC_01116]|uniref:hypothetical protein n=1 Tax=Streptomyces sp. NBC_01116 TaxID=2903752 RepID=UPI0032518B63
MPKASSPRRLALSAACASALLATTLTVPTAFADAPTRAVEGAREGVTAQACASGIATYVHDVSGDEGVLRKFLDWDPLTGNAIGALHDTGVSTPLDTHSRFFTGGHGIIYVVTGEGALKTYKDNTATGGSLLTSVRDYGGGWNNYATIVSGGADRIFALSYTGSLDIFSVADPASGTGAITKVKTVAATNDAVIAMDGANDVWAQGSTIYTLKRGIADRLGEVRQWTYSEAAGAAPFSAATVVVSGVGTKTLTGWSPGPGTTYTVGATPDHSGVARSYTGSGLTELANGDVGSGFHGDVHADIASCLASPPADAKPIFGSAPPEEPAPQAVTDASPDPAPQNPAEFTGRFTLGNGSPAAGLPVRVEAIDITSESTVEEELTTLGTAVTAADGTWKVSLPATLPADVSQAATANGGAINAVAHLDGQTASGQIMRGTDFVMAAPASAPAAARALVTSAAEDDTPSKIRPVTEAMMQESPQPNEVQTAHSWASRDERNSVDTLGEQPLPEYQSDTSGLPQGDPYIVKGVDTKAMEVRPMDGGCDRTKTKIIDRQIRYTAVVEGHAAWDSKATVEYDSKLSTNVEVAVKTGSDWTIEGSVTLGSAISASTGYTNKGPNYGKQWKVPIEYKKYKETWKCNYGKDTYIRYRIQGGKYKVPSGGAVGKYGKDVSNKDGSGGYYKSPHSHRAWVARGSNFQLGKNRSIKWSGAVSAFGVKLGASTQYDTDHKQRITAGTKSNARHDIWGKNDRVSGKPGVFYSF